MAQAREEQLRNNRRLARQLVGVLALLLMLIGLFTVAGWVVRGVRAAFDDSDERRDYETRLYGLVSFDTLPFEDAAQVDPAIFRQAAIWSILYQTQLRDGSFDAYERDTATGSLIIPQLEIDTYLTNLLGPDFALEEGDFSASGMYYQYVADRQGYLVPITSLMGMYTPTVPKISRQGGAMYVTVGYVPTMSNTTEMLFVAPTEPTKYMDYVFTKGENGQWYLHALQESTMQPEVTPAPTDAIADITDPQALLQGSLDGAAGEPVTPDMGGEDAGEDTGEDTGEPAPEDDGSGGEGEEGEPAPEDGAEGDEGDGEAAPE